MKLLSCLTLCDPIDGSPPGPSVPGILQARILEWVAISFSNTCMHAKSLQSCPTLCDPKDSSPPGSSVHRILQARTLEWVAISFSTSLPECKSDGFCQKSTPRSDFKTYLRVDLSRVPSSVPRAGQPETPVEPSTAQDTRERGAASWRNTAGLRGPLLRRRDGLPNRASVPRPRPPTSDPGGTPIPHPQRRRRLPLDAPKLREPPEDAARSVSSTGLSAPSSPPASSLCSRLPRPSSPPARSHSPPRQLSARHPGRQARGLILSAAEEGGAAKNEEGKKVF